MEPEKMSESSSCKNSVMGRIECGELCPRSKTFFKTRECAVWVLWFFSVIVGALAVAVTLFVVAHRQYGLYEATHENFYTFIIDVLPFVWIVLFGLMIIVGVYNLRHTKRGYRYPMWQIIGSSMVLSLAGGAALHVIGVGHMTDHVLGERMGMYNSQEKIERRMWQRPDDGRLIGTQRSLLLPPATRSEFVDIDGVVWFIDNTDLSNAEQDLLSQKQPVRLIGVVEDGDKHLFHPCGVFPWLLDKPMSRGDLHAAREAFETKVHGFGEKAEHMVQSREGRRDEDANEDSPCREIEWNLSYKRTVASVAFFT
jgi:hypothetical protein